MTVTIVKGLIQPLAAERNRSPYANSKDNSAQLQASQNAATAVSQSSDAVVTSLRSATTRSSSRAERGSSIENEREAKKVAEEVADGLRSDKDGQGLGAHGLKGGEERSLA